MCSIRQEARAEMGIIKWLNNPLLGTADAAREQAVRCNQIDKYRVLHYIVLRENKDMTTLTIRLPDLLKSDLDEISREEHKAVSDIVRESLRRYIAVEKFRSVRKRILPFAESQGLLTDDDIFKALS